MTNNIYIHAYDKIKKICQIIKNFSDILFLVGILQLNTGLAVQGLIILVAPLSHLCMVYFE